MAAACLPLSLVLGFLGQAAFALDFHVLVGLSLYAAAAWLFLRSSITEEIPRAVAGGPGFTDTLERPGAKRLEWLLVSALLIVGAFFRLYRLASQPLSLWLDESLAGLNALEIIEGKSAPIWGMTPLDRWRPDWVKTSNLYLYYVVAVFKVFGTGFWGLKMVSVLPAIASVVAAYYLFKEMTSAPIALVSAFLMAVSQWHVTVSRWGWDAVLMCFLQLVSYWLLLKGFNTGKKLYFAMSGVVMGLCLYTYVASWIALAIALSLLLLRSLLERGGFSDHFGNAILFFTPCLATFAPLGIYYWFHPSDLVVRTSEVSIMKAIQDAGSYYPAWESLVKYALMFNYQGDANAIHNFPREPVLDFVTAIFFVLGLAYYGKLWKNSHNGFAILWLALGLQAGLLSDPATSPHAYRTVMVSPVVYFIAGTAAVLSIGALRKGLRDLSYKETISVLAGVALLGYVALSNYSTYFVRRPKSREVWEEEGRDGRLPIKLKSLINGSQMILIDPLLLWKIVVSNSWFLSYQPGKLFESPYVATNLLIVAGSFSQNEEDREITYICPPVFLPIMRVLFPRAEGELIVSPSGDPVYAVLKLTSSSLLTRLQAVDGKWLASVIAKIALLYESEAVAVAREMGPKEKLLRNAALQGFALAKRLDPGLRP
jgi:hypothetical protein